MANVYTPVVKNGQLFVGEGATVLVCGWTDKDRIINKLTAQDYAAVGQLYSPVEGLSFLIRNLLANPQVTDIVVLEATNEDRNVMGGTCLKDFFEKGVLPCGSSDLKGKWQVNSKIPGYIDEEIGEEALELLRESIDVHYCSERAEAVALLKSLAGKKKQSKRAESLYFPSPPEPASKYLPGEQFVHRIEAKTVAAAWIKILHRIRSIGDRRPTGYGGQIQELVDLVSVITDEPEGFYFPDPNYLPMTREQLENYIPSLVSSVNKEDSSSYTYGDRLRRWFGQDQVQAVVTKLVKEIDSASGVMSLWDAGGVVRDPGDGRPSGNSDHQHSGSPCLTNIWVRVLKNRLSLTAVLRSNDMFGGWPLNAMALRKLQQIITEQVSTRLNYPLQLGPLITVSQSAHLYDRSLLKADDLIQKYYKKQFLYEAQQFNDPVGNFESDVDCPKGVLVAKQMDPVSNAVLRVYSATNPQTLLKKVLMDNPSIQASHAGYLGLKFQQLYGILRNHENGGDSILDG